MKASKEIFISYLFAFVIPNCSFHPGTSDLCILEPKLDVKPNPNCVPLEKIFYLQYQWMAFFVGALAVVYYLPYVMYCKVNEDIITLRKHLKSKTIPVEHIMKSFFKKEKYGRAHVKVRLLLNVLVKILYVCANLIAFLSLDSVLNGEYMDYGRKWINWARLHDTLQYDYMGMRDFPKPGNKLLPPFGYCEFYESAKDIKQSRMNKFKIICELSQHVLYQYCLLVIWFCLAIGIVASIIGLLHLLWTYVSNLLVVTCQKKYGITLKEMDYVLYIKTRDFNLYHELMERLEESSSPNGNVQKKRFDDVSFPLLKMCSGKEKTTEHFD